MNVHWPWLEGLFSLGGDAAQSSHSPNDDITSTLDGFLYRARLNPRLDMLYLSNNALEITGYEPDVLTRSPTVSYDTLIHPDDTEEVHDVLEQALRERSSFTVDYRLVDRRTNERWVEQQGEAVFDETDGRVLQGYIHDITEPQQLHLEDRIIRKAAEFVTQPGGFEETLESILQVICSMCNWEFGEIWFPQFVDSKTLTAQVHYNPDNGELEAFWEGNRTVKLERGEGLVGRVWETGETEWTESTGTDRTFLGSERARRAGLRTALGIPCKADEETVAVLVFYRNRKDKKSLMVDLLETVGKQIGSLLRKKQLEHKLNEQREFYQNLFLDSPAAILVSDLSAVKSRLDELSAGGVEDLEGHLLNHRDTLEELVGSIRPLDVNQSAKDMLNVSTADDSFPKSPVPFCNGETYEAFATEFSALYAGDDIYQDERPYVTEEGETIFVLNSSSVADQAEDNWSKIYFTFTDITDQKRYQKELQNTLDERMVLLQEIHHRVKNNLQIIISILGLQIRDMNFEPTVENVLEDVRNRIFSMALIHDRVFRQSSYDDIDVENYLKELVTHIVDSHASPSLTVELVFTIERASLNVDTLIPFGIIINELVSNALVHGFGERGEGTLTIDFRVLEDGSYRVTVTDDGRGWQSDDSFRDTSSLGTTLVKTLSRKQLHGDVEHLRTDTGVAVQVDFESTIVASSADRGL